MSTSPLAYRLRTALVTTLAILAAAAVFYQPYRVLRRGTIDALQARQAILAHQAARELEDFFNYYTTMLLTIAQDRTVAELDEQGRAKLSWFSSLHGDVLCALARLREQGADLVILDMIMGAGMGGRRTYEEILQIDPGQKAVVVSGFARNEEVERTLELGAGAFVRKPYTIGSLARALRAVLAGP